MRQDITISLVEGDTNVSIPFKAEFYDKGMRVTITNTFRVVLDRELTTSEKILSHHFLKTNQVKVQQSILLYYQPPSLV